MDDDFGTVLSGACLRARVHEASAQTHVLGDPVAPWPRRPTTGRPTHNHA